MVTFLEVVLNINCPVEWGFGLVGQESQVERINGNFQGVFLEGL